MTKVLVLLVLLTACSSHPPAQQRLTVFAAASLSGVLPRLGKDFEAEHPGTKVVISYAGSTALARQVIDGAPADVFASASPTAMQQVTAAGDAAEPRTFASNLAEIAAQPGSRIDSIADLATSKVALCDPSVPCGALAQKVLGKAHVVVKPVTLGLDVKSTLAYVTNGSVDAAIVYVTDVLAAGTKVKGIQIPGAVNASTAYSIATVRTSRTPTLARAFEDLVLSEAGKAVLAAAGFRAP
ncbi:MAG: molybdenum transporter, periplasmic molybdate-binding protein [Frankiales bacterium]|nr:molybdenum transporter, periplasmic molybdate-binding protein [Frankiales bacterium]